LEVVMVRVDVAAPPPVNVTAEGLNDRVGPEGAASSEREIVPVRPLRLFTVTVAMPDVPCMMTRLAGLEEIPKSGVVTGGRNVIEFPHPPGCNAP
jgi:hypothetical protein